MSEETDRDLLDIRRATELADRSWEMIDDPAEIKNRYAGIEKRAAKLLSQCRAAAQRIERGLIRQLVVRDIGAASERLARCIAETVKCDERVRAAMRPGVGLGDTITGIPGVAEDQRMVAVGELQLLLCALPGIAAFICGEIDAQVKRSGKA